MKTIAYEKSKILRITKNGLEYLDDQGIFCSINFHICLENIARELHSPGWVRVNESDDVYVGFRDYSAEPPYFLFRSDPQIRFEFPTPKSSFRVFIEHPRSSALHSLLMLFLLACGGFFVWVTLAASTQSD